MDKIVHYNNNDILWTMKKNGYLIFWKKCIIVDPPLRLRSRGEFLGFFLFPFFQAADGRWARAEECGGWQEATASLLRKTRTEERRKKKKKGRILQLEGACQRGRRRDGASLRNSGMTILDVFASWFLLFSFCFHFYYSFFAIAGLGCLLLRIGLCWA